MYEIYTIGGGRFLNQFFNAVASITQSSQFQYAILTAMLLAAAWIMFEMSFNVQNWQKPRVWLAGAVVIVGTMTGTTATVGITDRINTSGNIHIVDNVPYGLALFASLTSTMGDEITRLTETAFSSTNSPSLRDHGFLFGVRLLEKSTRAEIKNDDFSVSISGFIRNCTFYDIMLGLKSLDELKVAEDPWVYITSNPVKSRMFELRSPPAAPNIVTCFDGVGPLNAMWAPEIVDAGTRLVASASPGSDLNQAALRGIIYNDLGNFHEYLIGASTSATDILKRQMTINAIFREPAAWNSDVGNAAALEYYISARLDLQTRQSYGAIGRQAEKWVPNIKAVFQSLYYGVFPIAVLLMLSPIGITVLKNYIFGLIWIESWGPLYAILNYLMTAQAKEEMQAWVKIADPGAGNIQLAAQAGIQAVEADISIMAGYLSMSVPFIAIALVSGAGKFAHLATSTLGVTQEAVADTTRESATGNLSIGNTGFANHSFNQTNGFGYNTNMDYRSGNNVSSALDPSSGVTLSQFGPDGKQVVDGGGASARSMPMGVNYSDQLTNSLSKQAAHSTTLANQQGTDINHLQQSSKGWSGTLATQIQEGSTTGFTLNESEAANMTQDMSRIQSVAEDFSSNKRYSSSELIRAGVNVNTGLKAFGMGATAEAHYNNSSDGSVSYDEALKFSQQDSVKEAFSNITSASSSSNAAWSDGTNRSFSEAQNAAFNEIESLNESKNVSLNKTKRLEEASSKVLSESASINQDYAQPLFEYVAKELGGGPLGNVDAARLLASPDPVDIARRTEFANDFFQEIQPQLYERFGVSDLEGQYKPLVDEHIGGVNPENTAIDAGSIIKEEGKNIAPNHQKNLVDTKSNVETLIEDVGGEFDANKTEIISTGEATKDTVQEKIATNIPDEGINVLTKTAVGSIDALNLPDNKDAPPQYNEKFGPDFDYSNIDPNTNLPSIKGKPSENPPDYNEHFGPDFDYSNIYSGNNTPKIKGQSSDNPPPEEPPQKLKHGQTQGNWYD